MADAAVVGGGQAGLLAARYLAEAGAAVTLVERLPAAGGQEPELGVATELAAAALAAGTVMLLGTCAVRWDGARLRTLGVGGSVEIGSGAVVIATGTRPATRAELGIAGDRCAGVVPGSAALHLTEAGVLLGHRPVVLGGGSLAASCARALRRAGAERVTLVAPGSAAPSPDAAAASDGVLRGWTVEDVRGGARVQAITLVRDGHRERMLADALILAHGRLPMRNVEGAVHDAPGVVSCHSGADPKSLDDARATAIHATKRALELIRGRAEPPSPAASVAAPIPGGP